MTVGSARARHHTLAEPSHKPSQISGSDRLARAEPRA